MTAPALPPRLLSTEQAAAYLAVSPRLFAEHIGPHIPRLNVARPGAVRPTWRYDQRRLDEWIATRERAS